MSEDVLGSRSDQYWVLDQEDDYSYALVYACLQLTPADKSDFVYLFSRESAPFPDPLKDRWISHLNSKGVDTSDVRQIRQNGCWN